MSARGASATRHASPVASGARCACSAAARRRSSVCARRSRRLGADDLDPDVAALNLELGTALVFVGRLEEATQSLDRALIAAEALQLWEVLYVALSSTGVCCGFAGRFQQE